MNFKIELTSTLNRLLQHALRAPIDFFKERAIKFFHTDKIIAAIIGGTEHHGLFRLRQDFCGARKRFARHGGAVGIDQAHGCKTELQNIFSRTHEPVAQSVAPLRNEIKLVRHNVVICVLRSDGSVNGNSSRLSRCGRQCDGCDLIAEKNKY